jgi:acyl-CoA reductase-like NAD-dependent aldehyde dehydrogenase
MRIDGSDVTATETSVVTSPYDGREVGRVPLGSEAEVDTAVAVALERHGTGPLPAHERARILDDAAAAIEARSEEFAQLISDESAKPISTARVEAARCVDTFRFSAAVARTFGGEVIPMDASAAGTGKLGFTIRVPIGVVGAISPFNFPLNLVAHKVAPAIAAGAPVVLKPASATPLTALRLARMLEEDAGLPPGWLNTVTVPGSVADHLVTHDDVSAITFTGSPEVGWGIRSRAPRKRVGLELGNNAPVIVHCDADLSLAAERVAVGGYSFSGQTCISVQRIYAHQDIYEDFLAELIDRVEELKAGDPSDPATDVSSLIDAGETARVVAVLDEALDGGADLVTGGAVSGSDLIRPTVLAGVRDEMAVCRTEVFGPVVGVRTYSHLESALDAANDTRYGLQAGIFTRDVSLALEAARRLDFGGVCVNEVPTFRADQMPYGGIRDSGNTKEGPAWAVREMTEERMVVIQL